MFIRVNLKTFFSMFMLIALAACGNDESSSKTDSEKTSSKVSSEKVSANQAQPDSSPSVKTVVQENNGVVYQEEIYKNWPYTEAAPATTEAPVTETPEKNVEETQTMVEEQATATTAEKAPANPVSIDGGQVYNTYCAICHKLGMNAAPKYGNKALWAKRIAQGKDTVYSHALNGLRGMPPRGGFAQLTDEEVKAGVDYMVNAAGGWGK